MGGNGAAFFLKRFLLYQIFGKVPQQTDSFEGKTIIVTGSNTGLGLEAARHIVGKRATKVILAVRSTAKGEAAKDSIQESTACDDNIIEVWSLDLSNYASVKAFAARATAELPRIDAVIENAGVASHEWAMAEGNERMLTVNVISTFLLAFLLLPKLKDTATRYNIRPNITVVSSDMHFTVDFNEKDAPGGIFNNLNDEGKSDMPGRYATTKLLEVFVVREMAARGSADSYPVTINLVNPGLCKSELGREQSSFLFHMMNWLFARSVEVGSRNLVHGAHAGPETHGKFLDRCEVVAPATVVIGPTGLETQKRLYDELIAKLEAIEPGIGGNL